ncbi:MAG: 50S ribosomal protein L29 [Legionellaceae bacterium]
MKAKDLRAMNKEALQTEMLAVLREQFNLRIQKSTGQLTKPHLINKVRKNIARIKTVLNELG